LVTNVVKEEFKDIEIHDGGGLNLMVIRDTQSSRKIDFPGYRGSIFLDFWFQRRATGDSSEPKKLTSKMLTGYNPAQKGGKRLV
jgi:hypothetical protein